uniref:Uncharacterized protein MANES_11G086600 n=1 Tax=Rhizophora mucronata TaxID=61149 RepID=A0A2P2LLN4_RHIMU
MAGRISWDLRLVVGMPITIIMCQVWSSTVPTSPGLLATHRWWQRRPPRPLTKPKSQFCRTTSVLGLPERVLGRERLTRSKIMPRLSQKM